MPAVKNKEGNEKHFAYTAAGMKQAQDYAKQTGGTVIYPKGWTADTPTKKWKK
tara:strand:+ start:367 stop:525 length:159 start_codon:yes stop_codon:yes gene_type:complete